MERVKGMVIVLIQERNRAIKRCEDLSSELSVVQQTLTTTEENKKTLAAEIFVLDDNLDNIYQENSEISSKIQDLECSVDTLDRESNSNKSEIIHMKQQLKMRKEKFRKLEETFNEVIENCFLLGDFSSSGDDAVDE